MSAVASNDLSTTKGLTLQAGWEDKLDFGLDLYRDPFEASLRILTPIYSPRALTPVDLDALEAKTLS